MPSSLAPMRFQGSSAVVTPAAAAAATTSVGRSPLLFDGINLESLYSDYAYGFGNRRNYVSCPKFVTVVTQDGQYPFLDTSATIAGLALKGGGAKFSTAGTDNNAAGLQEGGASGSSHVISLTSPTDFAFERRFRVDQITETGLLVGMAEEGCAANNAQVDDTGALADKDYIGLHIPMNASAAVGAIVYRKAGQTAQTVLASALTCVAGTFYKFGARFRAKQGLLDFAINGQLVYSLDLVNDVTASLFPFDQLLSAFMHIKTGEAVDKTACCTWHETAQRF